MWAGVIRLGLPSTTSKPTFISGIVLQRLDQRVADEVGERHLAAAGAGEVVVDDGAVVPQQLDRDASAPTWRWGRCSEASMFGDRAGRARRAARVQVGSSLAAAGAAGRVLGDRGCWCPAAGSAAAAAGAAWRPGSGRSRPPSARSGFFSAGLVSCFASAGFGLGSASSRRAFCSAPARRASAAPPARGPASSAVRARRTVARGRAVGLEVLHPLGRHAVRVLLVLVVHLVDEPLVGSEVGGLGFRLRA